MRVLLILMFISSGTFAEEFFFTRDVGQPIKQREFCRSIKKMNIKTAKCKKNNGIYCCGDSFEMYFVFPFSSKEDCEKALKSSLLSANPKLDKGFLLNIK